MAIETEKKYRLTVPQHRQVLAALKEFDAKFSREDFEENILFQNDFLIDKRAVLRLRKIGEKTILTYKQRIQNEFNIKRQIEYETTIENTEAIEKIIENLGLTPQVIYEKRRQTWHLNNLEIVLDELPFGLFMEIEGSITEIAQVEMLLDIEDFSAELETYPRLTKKFGVPNGAVIEARFAK